MKKYPVVLFLLLSNIGFSQINLSKGLVAYYPFNGDAKDASGNGNDPVFNNATLATDRFGNANSAYSFNGINSYIRVPNSPSLNPSPQISICAWVKVQGFYLGPCRGTSILMKANTEGPPGYKLRIDENHYPNNYSCGPNIDVDHQFFYGLGQPVQKPDFPWIQKDQWYSVVYTYDGKTTKLYVDCKLQISYEIPGMILTNSEDLFIGKTNLPFYPYWFNGVLDEIRIYNRAINQTEVMGYGGCCKIVNSKTNNPASVCSPAAINLKDPAITSGSDPNLSFTYFTDSAGINPLSNPDPTSVNLSGTYYIKGTGTGLCTTVDPVIARILDRPSPLEVAVVNNCDVTSTLSTTATGTLLWSTNETTPSITVKLAGTYSVTQTVNGCTSLPGSGRASPKTPPSIPIITVVNNCDGTSTLSTTAIGTLLWNNNSTSQSITISTAGFYSVTQTINGCTSQPSSVNVDPGYNKSGYVMPTAFTPNKDGLNDCFGLKYWGTVTKLSFRIYNRFGQMVFYTSDQSKWWDGTYKGKLQNVGTYVYIINATTSCDIVKRKGTFILLR